MFNNLKIGHKLAVGFAVPLVLFAAFGIWLQMATGNMIDIIGHVRDESVPFALKAKNMEKEVIQVQQWLQDISATRGLDGFDDGFKGAAASRDSFYSELAAFEKMFSAEGDQQGLDRVKRIKADFDAYYANGVKMAQAYVSGGPAEGNKFMMQFDQFSESLQNNLVPFVKSQTDEMETFSDRALSTANQLRQLAMYVLLAIVAIILLLGRSISLSITRPLGGEPHEAIAVFESIAAGDLTIEVPVKAGDKESLMFAAQQMRDRLRSMLADLRETGTAISAASQSMATAGAQVEQSSGAQSEAASAVAAAVEQTSVSISETASNAHTADETATRARAEIEKTLTAVRETADNVDKLAGMIGEASSDIAHLAESSRKIDGIVRTIKDIADQTNLLALNAAIEAARAGEQGRGFAVVADEVRKLAENTTKATSEISGLIGGIQSEVDGAVARMAEANDKAGTTRDHVIASTGALDAASADTGRVTESVRSIAAAVREQDVAVQQVAERMEQIAQMTEENTAAAANAADTARQLDTLAGKLREAVGRFKV